MTDEKLVECSASATGVFIRLMCIMHKSDPYGTILLKQKDKQTDQQIKNFALKIAKNMPFSEQVIFEALTELIDEGVLKINGDCLEQKRMISDCLLSEKRAKADKEGGEKTKIKNKNFATDFAQAKMVANPEYENEYENESDNVKRKPDLIFPFTSKEFMETWGALVKEKKWKRKSNSALQASLKQLSQFDEQFAIDLMLKAISGNYQGVVFSNTKSEYLKQKNATNGKSTDKNGHTIIAGRVTQEAAANLLAAARLHDQRKKDADGNAG